MSALSGAGATNPNIIQGQIPFTPAAQDFGSALGGNIGSAYTSSYNNALAQNAAQYQNILGGYQQTAQNQFGAQQPIAQGYNDLTGGITSNLGNAMNNAGQTQAAAQGGVQQGYGALSQNVQNTIQGITASQQQAIQDAYAQQQGSTSQQLINSGLGNTTIMGSMQTGNTLSEQKAMVALANQQAQLSAGYQSQLGLAGLGYAGQSIQANTAQSNLSAQQQAMYGSQLGSQALGYQNQANMQNTQQANNQLGFMNSVQMQYPNAQSYQQAAQYQGAYGLAQSNQAFNQQLALRGFANQGRTAPPIGAAPNNMSGLAQGGYGTPSYGSGDMTGGNYGGVPVSAGLGGGGGYTAGGAPSIYGTGMAVGQGQPSIYGTGMSIGQGGAPSIYGTGMSIGGSASGYDASGNFVGSGNTPITTDDQDYSGYGADDY